MTQSEKIKTLAIFYMASGFVRAYGQPPQSDQELAEYVRQAKDSSAQQWHGEHPDELTLINAEFDEAEDELIDAFIYQAEKFNVSCAVIAEGVGFTANIVAGESKEFAFNALCDYLDKQPVQAVSRIEVLFERKGA